MTSPIARLSLEQLRCFNPFDFLTQAYQQQVLDSLQYLTYAPGTPLLQRGQRSLALYYLLSGTVARGEGSARILIHGGTPEAIQALNQEQPHLFNVTAETEVRLFSIERGLLDRLLSWSQGGAHYQVQSLAESEEHDEEGDWLGKLLATPLFGRLAPSHLQTLLARFEYLTVRAGDSVVRYGEPGEHFYVLKQGRAQVSLPGAEGGAVLEVGDFFGEEALVSGAVRSANVTMLEDGELARLAREPFVELVRPSLIPQISSRQLEKLTGFGGRAYLLLDVRLPLEYRQGHHPGSLNLPVSRLRGQAESLARDTVYGVTAEGGIRSELAVHLLNQLGFEAYLLDEQPGQPPVAA